MRNARDIELECPRCRMRATRRGSHVKRCTYCDDELVAARSPSEKWIRAYLYGDGIDSVVSPLVRVEAVAQRMEVVAR